MAENTDSPRTEEPTTRRRQESRRKGQTAFSSDLSNGLSLLVASAILWWAGRMVGEQLLECLQLQLSQLSGEDWGIGETSALAQSTFRRFLSACGWLVGGLFAVTLALGFLQAGFHLTLDPLKLDWNRISVTKGWSKLFSMRAGVRGLMTVVKVAVIVGLVWWLFRVNLSDISLTTQQSLLQAISVGWSLIMKAAMAVGGGFAFLGILDYGFQRWRHEQDLRMTRQQVKDEHKQEEGDPQLKARIRKLQREIAQRQMMQDVPDATVVLTNPTHFAVAVRYDRVSNNAPEVVAKGADHVAKRIVSIARDHGIPVVENKPLARTLFKAVDVGQQIPISLYRAVAEILARIYGLRP
jgi:flagellar biosynthetic protein FlhB